ncbi:hypothetical protein JCM8097_000752 [Rhodosporidiobolus ruineniae]
MADTPASQPASSLALSAQLAPTSSPNSDDTAQRPQQPHETPRTTPFSTTPPTYTPLPPAYPASPSSPTRSIQRSFTTPLPASPTKSIRPLPPIKSGTDGLVLELKDKARSVSSGVARTDAVSARGSRSREPSKLLEQAERASGQRRERVYLEKFKLYETKTKLYIIGCDDNETRFSVLKVDRVAPVPRTGHAAGDEVDEEDDPLTTTEDPMVYTRQQKDELVETLKAGNGGVIKVMPDPKRYRSDGWHPFFYGIVGFVRLSSSYRLVLVTHRQKVALLGGHYVFHSESTQLYPITPSASTTYATEDYKQEAAFSSVHLSKNFYFRRAFFPPSPLLSLLELTEDAPSSYSYDITNTLQRNLLRGDAFLPPADKFAWNWHLLTPLRRALKLDSPWILPLVHGVVEQAKIEVFSRPVFVTLIARRSRHFAGARYLRRGCNEQGWCANDVESEQIVSEELVTPFHVPSPSPFHTPASSSSASSTSRRTISPRYTSYVQIRGSIPLAWMQDTTKGVIKLEVKMAHFDPFYAPAAKHFDQLFEAYGGRLIAMNLIKQTDNRESVLIPHFRECVAYLNQFLPDEHKIEYIEFDQKQAYKRSRTKAQEALAKHAEASLLKTGFFHSGPEAPRRLPLDDELDRPERRTTPMLQQGVVRTNCIDCIDRTNTAQLAFARVVLGHQLHALGFLPSPHLPVESDAVRLLEQMYNLHGDLLAMQYSGSNALHQIDSRRELEEQMGWPQWRSQSRDKVEAVKRLYANNFGDAEKQAAIDVFLGITPSIPPPPSFEYLPPPPRRSYQDWFTPSHLLTYSLSASEVEDRLQQTVDAETGQGGEGGWWPRYYKPNHWTTFTKFYPYNMGGTLEKTLEELRFPIDPSFLSPLIPRRMYAPHRARAKSGGLRSWMAHRPAQRQSSRIVSGSHMTDGTDSSGAPSSSAAVTAGLVSTAPIPPLPSAPFSAPTAQLATSLLNPVVRADEAREYDAWTAQFRHLSLAAQDHLPEKDRGLYAAHAAVSVGEVSERDRAVFAQSVAAASGMGGGREVGGGKG